MGQLIAVANSSVDYTQDFTPEKWMPSDTLCSVTLVVFRHDNEPRCTDEIFSGIRATMPTGYVVTYMSLLQEPQDIYYTQVKPCT